MTEPRRAARAAARDGPGERRAPRPRRGRRAPARPPSRRSPRSTRSRGCSSTCRWPTSTGPSTTPCRRRWPTAAQPGVRVKVRFAGQDVDGYVVARAADVRPRGPAGRRCGGWSAPSGSSRPEVAALTADLAERYAGTRSDVLRLAVPARHATTEKEPSARGPRRGRATRGRGRGRLGRPRPGAAFLRHLADGGSPRAVWAAPPGTDWPLAARPRRRRDVRRRAAAPWSACPTARTWPGSTRRSTAVLGEGHHVLLTADAGPARALPRLPRRQPRARAGSSSAPAPPLRARPRPRPGGDLGRRRRPARRAPRAVPPHPRDAAAARRARGHGGAGRRLRPHRRGASTSSAPAGPASSPRRARSLRERVTVGIAGASDRDLERDPLARAARIPRQVHEAIRAALERGPVLVQTPRPGTPPSLACERCRTPRPVRGLPRPARADRADHAAGLPLVRHRRRARGPAPSAATAACARPSLGDARTAEELGRTFPAIRVRTSQRRPGARRRRRRARRSWWPPRAPSRSPRAATPRWCCSTPGCCSAAPTCAPTRRRCAAGATPPAWSGPAGAVVVGRGPRPPGAAGAGALGPGRLRGPRDARAAGGPPAARQPDGDRDRRAGRRRRRPDPARRRRPGAEVLGPVAGRGEGESRVVVRVPRAQGRALSRALGDLQRMRSSRKLDAVRDPGGPADPLTGQSLDCRSHPPSARSPVAIQPIRLFGDPVLRKPAIEVVDFDKELRKLVADLTDTMLEAPGAGLAAPQIGVGLRAFTWNVDGEVGHLVNPRLELSDGGPGRARGLPVDPRAHLRLPPRALGGRPRLRHVRRAGHDRGLGLPRPRDPARDRPPRRRAVRRPPRRRGPQGRDEGDPRVRLVRPGEADGQGLARTPPADWGSDADAAGLRRHPRGRRALAGRRSPSPATSSSASSPAPTRPPAAAASWSPARSRSAPRSSASRCSSPSTRATRSSRRRCAPCAPDCCPVVAYGALLPQSALDIPVHGWVNLHFSVLPAWRGAAPVQHSIWAGDEVTGATTFRIVKELDAGPDVRGDDRADPPDRHRRRPARPAGRGRRRAAGRHPRRHRGRLAGGPSAAGRGRQLRPEDHRRGRAGRLVRAGRGGRPPDPRVHARPRRLVDLRRRADQDRPGHRPPTGTRWRRARSTSPRTPCTSAPAPSRSGSARSRRTARKQMDAADWARGVRLETGARFA